MTREDAFEIWLPIIKMGVKSMPECSEALDMAIKALKQEPCTDAISRQAVLEAIDTKAWEFCDYLISKGRNEEQKPVSHFADNLRECISENLPPVTPAEKVGKWEWKQYDIAFPEIGNYHCSSCDAVGKNGDNYCSVCGAKMSASPTGAEGSEEE